MRLVEEIRDNKAFYEKLESSLQTLIDRYSDYFDSSKKDRLFILNNLSRDLERISNLLDNYGYTYSPTSDMDMSEDTFEVAIGRYLEQMQKYIDGGEGNIETINVLVKTLLNLVDRHKTVSEHFV